MTTSTKKLLLTNFFSSPKAQLNSPRTPIFDVPAALTPKRKKVLKEKDPKQAILDAGQSNIGGRTCSECGMFYTAESEEDRLAHEKFHNSSVDLRPFVLKSATLDSWKESLSYVPTLERYFLLVLKTSPSTAVSKVQLLVENFVNKELGFSSELPIWTTDRGSGVWMSIERQEEKLFISGLLVYQSVHKSQWNDSHESFVSTKPLFGINRIWIHPMSRKKGIAKQLVQTAMRNLSFKRFAISEPTAAGQKLALSLVGDDNRYLEYFLQQ